MSLANWNDKEYYKQLIKIKLHLSQWQGVDGAAWYQYEYLEFSSSNMLSYEAEY